MTPALQFAISLVFVYLLLSALSSTLQEAMANLLKWRANTLEIGIANLLGSQQLKDAVYKHPLVQGIFRPNRLFMAASKFHKPAYISSAMFAQVLQDLGSNQKAPEQVRKDATAILDLVAKAEETAEAKRKKIEHWFDDAMDSVSGWYKRKSHAWLWVISLAVCAAMNADTITIGKTLWNDPTAREATSDAAKQYAKDYSANNGHADDPDVKKEFEERIQRVQTAQQDLSKLSVPLGWCTADCENDPRAAHGRWEWLLKLAGILISVLAVSQGAPFWFDLLQKAVNLRLAGDPPPDSRKQTQPTQVLQVTAPVAAQVEPVQQPV